MWETKLSNLNQALFWFQSNFSLNLAQSLIDNQLDWIKLIFGPIASHRNFFEDLDLGVNNFQLKLAIFDKLEINLRKIYE